MINLQDIFAIKTDREFEEMALNIFRFQFENNRIYRSFCDLLLRHPSNISKLEEIPFLPIQFFKSHDIILNGLNPEKIFLSSGTTTLTLSRHLISDLEVYKKSFVQGFQHFYGDIHNYCILALLPSYLEQGDSSLIFMMKHLIDSTNHHKSGFYLDNLSDLSRTLMELENANQKTILVGVSYALLDFIEKKQLNLKHTKVMETGGMKGRRKEMIREELHKKLCEGFGVDTIHSEYGMTELLSQAYSKGLGKFKAPPWMKVLTRSIQNPLEIIATGKSGGINIIDLANINSCSFIATQDLGKVYDDGEFEVIGRFDDSEIRGCNLLVL